jgi:hypothetical protein
MLTLIRFTTEDDLRSKMVTQRVEATMVYGALIVRPLHIELAIRSYHYLHIHSVRAHQTMSFLSLSLSLSLSLCMCVCVHVEGYLFIFLWGRNVRAVL